MFKITSKITYDLTKIYINNIIHLAFIRRDTIGFQTWKSDAVYFIELTFRNGATIVTEYDDVEKWQDVIKIIEYNLTP